VEELRTRWKELSESVDGEVLICWVALLVFGVIALVVLS
jgi:hypothetical protein